MSDEPIISDTARGMPLGPMTALAVSMEMMGHKGPPRMAGLPGRRHATHLDDGATR